MKKTDVPEKEIDIETIKTLLDKDPQKRNVRDIMQLSNEIKNIAFFKKYQDDGYGDVHIQCAKYMKYSFVKKTEAVFHIDTVGDKFYLTLKGRVGIYIRLPRPQSQGDDPKADPNQLTCVKELEAGFAFGELALLNNKPRLATIMCHEDTHFMTLDKLSFILILKQKEEEKLFKEMGFFAKLPFFEGWNHNLIKLIYLNSFRIKYSKNEKIFSEGDEPASIYIVTEGEFVGFNKIEEEDEFGFKQTEVINYLKKEGGKQKKQIPNEMFGEEDVMNKNKSRTYSAVCQTVKGECIVVKKRDFELRILHEEGARLYLENRLKQKNNYMQEKLQKIQGSIADYQNYLYDDRGESKQKLQISIAISKIESPKKVQKGISSFMEFPSIEIDTNNNSPIGDSQQPFIYSSSNIDKSSITRKQEPQGQQSPLLKRGQSIVSAFGVIQTLSNGNSINNTQAEDKGSYLRLGSSMQKTRSIIELDQIEQKQNKEMQLRKSVSIIEPQTPWRDQLTNSKNITETFKNLFSQESELQKHPSNNLLKVPQEQMPYRRQSKLSYSQTLLIPHSSAELGDGISPIQKRIAADECFSPIKIKRQLSQVNTPITQMSSILSTPMTQANRHFKGKSIPFLDTFSSSLKNLSSSNIKNSQQQQQQSASNCAILQQDQIDPSENIQPIKIPSYEKSNSMLSSSPLLKQKYEQIIKQKELLKKQRLQVTNNQSNNIIENSFDYASIVLSSPSSSSLDNRNKLGYSKQSNSSLKQDAQATQQQALQNSDGNNQTKFGLIRLRKSQENIEVHLEEEEGKEGISSDEDISLIMNMGYKSKQLSKKQSMITLNKMESIESNSKRQQQNIINNQSSIDNQLSFNNQISIQKQPIPEINLKPAQQENQNNKQLSKNIQSLNQIEDDITSYKHSNSEDSNRININQNQGRNLNDSSFLQEHRSMHNQQYKQHETSQDSAINGEESVSIGSKTHKLNLKIKDITQRTQDNIQQKISDLENAYNKVSSVNSLDSIGFDDKGEAYTVEEQTNQLQQKNNRITSSINSKSQNGNIISEDAMQNLLKNQKAVIHKKIIYNSSFSPMKGMKKEPQSYKFEQYKDSYFLKHSSKNNNNNGDINKQNQNFNYTLQETATNEGINDSMKMKTDADGFKSPPQPRISIADQPSSLSPNQRQKNIKQITNQQKVQYSKLRKYNRSLDFAPNIKQDLSLRMGNFANQTVRTRMVQSKSSLSPTLSPSTQSYFNTFKSNRVVQQQPFLLNMMNGSQNEIGNQIEVNALRQSPSKLQILKQSIEARALSHSPDKLLSKHTIVYDNHINFTDIYNQKRYSAVRVYNKSEQNGRGAYIQEDTNLQINSVSPKKQINNFSKVLNQQTSYNQKLNSQQMVLPIHDPNEIQTTQKQATFKEKMRSQIASSQNIAKSSLNNPYSNITLISQHQQIHKYFNKHSSLLQNVAIPTKQEANNKK